jgi:hypothetical protein
MTASPFIRGLAVVSVGLNLEAAFLFAVYPAALNQCTASIDCLPPGGPLVLWQLILAVGWIPLLLLVWPRASALLVGSQSFLIGLTLGLFFSNAFVLALPLLFLGAFTGFVIGMLPGIDGAPRSPGRLLTVASSGWAVAAVVLVLYDTYSPVNVGIATACVSSPSYSSCITYGPFLWPYAQALAAILLVGGLAPLLMLLRPQFWPVGFVGAGTIMWGLLWILTINLPSNAFPVGTVATFGAILLFAASSAYTDQWWPWKKALPHV